MAKQQTGEAGEQRSLEVLDDRTRAWWTSVLAGQMGEAHPVHGTDISAHLDGDVLVVTGKVPSEADREEIAHEVEHLRGHGVAGVRIELEVKPANSGDKGLLEQTLIGVFEDEAQAGFAEGYLEGHAHVRPEAMRVFTPAVADRQNERVHDRLPEQYWRDADRALESGRSLLIVTVDETEAFQVRELLDEETHSLETIVLPPQPIQPRHKGRDGEGVGGQAPGGDESDPRVEAGRRQAHNHSGAQHGV